MPSPTRIAASTCRRLLACLAVLVLAAAAAAANPDLGLRHNIRSALVIAAWRSPTDDKRWTEQFEFRNRTWERLNASYKTGQACVE